MKIYKVGATSMIGRMVAKLQSSENPLDKKIIFCEDKFTLQIELAIADYSGGSFGTNVFSFNRYMHKHLKKSEKVLSPEACVLAVKNLLLENKKQLLCFKSVYDPNLAGIIYELIAQLKSAKVTPSDIDKVYEETSGNLKRKLHDIYLLFDGYERYIAENNITDGNNRLSSLPAFFDGDEEIKDTDVIVAGFPSLNRTLCEIFKSLARNAKSLTFVAVAGENKGVYTNEVYDFVRSEFAPDEIEVDCDKETMRLLGGLYRPLAKSENGIYSNRIHLYRAKTHEEEIKNVASIIRNKVAGGARYRDFAVCAENIAPYELTLKSIFADYEIPVFCDITKNLGKHPLTRLVLSYIDMVRRNFDPKDVLDFAKNQLFIPDKELSDGFENYFIKCGINRKTVKEPFKEEDENLDFYEIVRKKIIEVGEYLPKNRSFSETISAIDRMLERVGALDNLDILSEWLEEIGRGDILAVNKQVKEKFDSVLSDACAILGGNFYPLKEVKNIILSGMTACKISVIIESGDCVFAGDFKGARYQKNKNLFVIGLSDGVPSSKLDSALLCDRDIAKMEKSQVLVEPKIKEVNRRARETCCMALASFTDNLYLSYSARSVTDENVMQSEIFSYIEAIFSDRQSGKFTSIYDSISYEAEAEKLGGEREKNYKVKDYMSKRTALFAFAKDICDYKEGAVSDFSAASSYYKYIADKPDGDAATALLGGANSEIGYYTDGVNYAEKGISATAIEGYFACPYANFLSRGVRLKEREVGKIQANVLGTMFHKVAELFVQKVDFDGGEEKALSIANEIFSGLLESPEYRRYSKSESGRRSFELIGDEVRRFCLQLFRGCVHSSLKPVYLEVSFGMGGMKPLNVATKNGIARINGRADRIDVDDENMRIVDYKTGTVRPQEDDKLLYMGNKLQLYLYAKALNDKYQPIGVYYFPVQNNFASDDSNQMQLKGKTIADDEKAKLSDDSLADSKKGFYINADLTKNKEGGYRYGNNMLSKDEFDCYMDYAAKVAGEGISEIQDGVILPSPSGSACLYCQYKGLCGYDEATDCRTRDFAAITKKHIMHAERGEMQEEAGEEDKF